jgi:hypothetical protein
MLCLCQLVAFNNLFWALINLAVQVANNLGIEAITCDPRENTLIYKSSNKNDPAV